MQVQLETELEVSMLKFLGHLGRNFLMGVFGG